MARLLGATVNGLGILLGSTLGLIWGRRFSEEFRRQAMRVMGLVVLVIGLKMALPLSDPINVLISVVVGAFLGARLKIGQRLEHFGRFMEARANRGAFMDGFISAILIFNVGALAIVGSLQAGLKSHPTILETKAVLDGVTALLLTSSVGWGVTLAAPATFLYEGLLTILAASLRHVLVGALLTDLSVVGGVLIAAIGVNFLSEKTVINIADLLPALVLTVILGWLKLHGVSFV